MPQRPAPGTSSPTGGTRAITLRLPEELYEWLRMQAFLQRRSMNELAIEALAELRAHLPEQARAETGREGRAG